jgi:hypothetical protein
MIRVLKSLILIVCISGVTPVEAKIYNVKGLEVEIQGYLGYQYIGSTTPKPGHSLDSSPQAGIVLNLKINNNWTIYNQFRYDSILQGIPVYNFIEYTPDTWHGIDFKIVAGNIIHNYGLYGNRRQNPRTRPSIIEPQAIYWNILEQTLTSGLGVGFAATYKDVTIRYDISEPRILDNRQESAAQSGQILNSIQAPFGSNTNLNLAWNPRELPIRTNTWWSHQNDGNNINSRVPASIKRAILADGGFTQDVVGTGIEYSRGPITLSAEGMLVKHFDIPWSQIIDKGNKGFSLSGIYDINDEWSVRVNYNQYKSKLANVSQLAVPQIGYAKDLNFGVDYTKNSWLIRAEMHHIQGGRWVQPDSFKQDPNSFKDWWMGGVSVTYFFN